MKSLGIFLLFLQSCSSFTTQFDQKIKGAQCEEAADLFSKKGKEASVLQKGKKVGGSVLSYTASGVGYATDVLVWFTREVGVRVAICTPVAAIEMASGGQGSALSGCFSGITTSFGDKPTDLGNKIYKGTTGWRCADLTPLSKRLRKLASCHVKRGNEGDLIKAQGQLKSITDNKSFYKCIKDSEKQNVKRDLDDINNKLK